MACEVRHLRAGPQREPAVGRVPVGDAAAALERRRALAVGAKRARDHRRRPREGGFDIAAVEAPREEQVPRRRVVDQRRVVTRGLDHVHDGRSRLVLDANEAGGILRRVAIGCDDRGDGFAHVTDGRPGQHRLRGLDVAGQRRARSNALPRDEVVAARDDCHHARGPCCRTHVDVHEARVRVRAAHEGHVQHSRHVDIAHVAPAAGEQPRVLAPAHRGAERRRRLEGVDHGCWIYRHSAGACQAGKARAPSAWRLPARKRSLWGTLPTRQGGISWSAVNS